MPRFLLIISIVFVVISFIIFLMGLLKFIPTVVGGAILFISILVTVSVINQRNQFRGFDQ
ncbi:hypothetical protein ABFG93_03595 [Pseudalkalibacillus hwajinpoensis]|uniref:hypothetical protein n=1 Tax=Guptibacillus hwajinpoensis TaxID=208199 RepID=UPI00325B9E0F